MTKPIVSVVIPVYNEEKVISDCLESLSMQSYNPLEIILVDDGSTDQTIEIIKNLKLLFLRKRDQIKNWILLKQNHLGPGPARNLGAKHAKGQILVFVDADMTFAKDFIKDLVAPIIEGQTIGTFSKNEIVKNDKNIWSICWNINRNLPSSRMIPEDYPDTAPVFRAIKKTEFTKVGGFEATGQYTDDWSLSKKLGTKSTLAPGAAYYHSNPSTLVEVYKQARWIGKNEFISGSLLRQTRALILYSLPVSIFIGIAKSVVSGQLSFVVFKIIYDLAVWISVLKSFGGENKAK